MLIVCEWRFLLCEADIDGVYFVFTAHSRQVYVYVFGDSSVDLVYICTLFGAFSMEYAWDIYGIY